MHRDESRGKLRACAASRRGSERGMTLVELIVAFTILLILTSMAVPLARAKVRAERERELRYCLRTMDAAIDKYKDYCDQGYFGMVKEGTNCYPESLEILVDGQKLNGPDGKKIRFLRKIPIDPFTHNTDWGLRSDADDPKATSWGGQNVFAVYSKTTQKAADGTSYSEW
ncbi:MAG TPA: type II secretion system protein [Verrucomicrobiae bacterium]|nr:type II secretion system protein [Verrucomicrobiae bacterium]